MNARLGSLLRLLALLLIVTPAVAGWGDPLKIDQYGPVDYFRAPSWRDGDANFYFLCADDFVCTEPGRISEIHVRGIDDPYNLGVEVFFWADVPASEDGDSHPGELLYYSGWLPVANPSDPNHYGWYDAGGGEFHITLPEYYRFLQQGTPDNPVVYWVGVQVRHDVFGMEEFNWSHRQPGFQDGGPAAFSADGENWVHWGRNPLGVITTYSGSLPTGWQPVDLTFQLYGAALPQEGVISNPSFEIEWAGEMPNGGWTDGPPYRGMPESWQWRRVGNVNGHGEAFINNPEWNYVSDGDFSLYMFASRYNGGHYPGDLLEFYQTVDLTDVLAVWFDVSIHQNDHSSLAYVAVDGEKLWFGRDVREYPNQYADVRSFSGTHELALGIEITQEFGDLADGHTFFDNLRVCGPGDMDGDLDIDSVDLELLADCLSCPDCPHASGCAAADLDHDGDVDLQDFIVLQANCTGALALPS
ncbi:MAG: dockerin type I repeat-containing protein [Phycisphaerae bacterium]|jgi:hypothetical protein